MASDFIAGHNLSHISPAGGIIKPSSRDCGKQTRANSTRSLYSCMGRPKCSRMADNNRHRSQWDSCNHCFAADIGAGDVAGVVKGIVARLESDERLAGGKLLDGRVEMLDLLSRQRARERHHPDRQQRGAQVFAIGFGHVVLPED
jgi:hypothetical protein